MTTEYTAAFTDTAVVTVLYIHVRQRIYNNNNNIYLKSSIQTSSIDYKNYYGMYKYNKYDYTNRSVIIING